MNNFHANLATGRKWEEKVSRWLQEGGSYVLTVYDYTGSSGGGKTPKMFIVPPEDSLILPDLQVAADGETCWIEVKSKSGVGIPFPDNPYYTTTGFDLKYWEHYLKVRQVTGLPVYVFFVHYNEGVIRCGSLEELDTHPQKFIHRNGMVYWPYNGLRVIATIDQQENIQAVPS